MEGLASLYKASLTVPHSKGTVGEKKANKEWAEWSLCFNKPIQGRYQRKENK